MTNSADFILRGDLMHMAKLLLERPELPVTCNSDWIGHPVSLVVSEAWDSRKLSNR